MKSKRIDNANKGFTLVEVIVASFILIAAIVPLLSSFMVSQKVNVKGRQKEQAMTVAQNIVETVKAVGAKTAYNMAVEGLANAMGSGNIALEGTLDDGEATYNYTEGGTVKTVKYKKNNYSFKVTEYEMGLVKYDAIVTVTLDDSDLINVLAYEHQGDYDELKLPVMKYYKVVAKVSLSGETDVMATYTGSFVTKN